MYVVEKERERKGERERVVCICVEEKKTYCEIRNSDLGGGRERKREWEGKV